MKKEKKFVLKKVLENKGNRYQVIDNKYNLHIFYYELYIYAYSYVTCMFYKLRYDDNLRCYYIVETLNNDRKLVFKVWEFTKDPKNGKVTEVMQKMRGNNYLL